MDIEKLFSVATWIDKNNQRCPSMTCWPLKTYTITRVNKVKPQELICQQQQQICQQQICQQQLQQKMCSSDMRLSFYFEPFNTWISWFYGTVVVKIKNMAAKYYWKSSWMHGIIEPVVPYDLTIHGHIFGIIFCINIHLYFDFHLIKI
jgi:hypothetical protein